MLTRAHPRGALRQLGVAVPTRNDHPKSLEPWLHRRMWASSVGRIVAALQEGVRRPFFDRRMARHAAQRAKVFPSRSTFPRKRLWRSNGLAICSEVVEWKSEFRFYLMSGQIVGAALRTRSVDQGRSRGNRKRRGVP